MGFEPLTLHRLDMNTTGVVLFAKKKDIVDRVHAQFRCGPPHVMPCRRHAQPPRLPQQVAQRGRAAAPGQHCWPGPRWRALP